MGVGNISGDPGMMQDLMPCLRKETGAQIYHDAAAARRKAIDPCRCEIHLAFKKCSLDNKTFIDGNAERHRCPCPSVFAAQHQG